MGRMRDFAKQVQSTSVTIKVGQGEALETYTLPKDLLCAKSKWFDKALKDGKFKEGITDTISLPEDSSVAFDAFVSFIYSENLTFDDYEDEPEARSTEILECLDIWTFGDKYVLPKLQDAIMHRLCSVFDPSGYDDDKPIEAATLTKCFKSTCDHPVFRCLVAEYVVERVAAVGSALKIEGELGQAERFLVELHAAQTRFRAMPPNEFPRCKKPRKFKDVFSVLRPEEEHEDDNPNGTCWGQGWTSQAHEFKCHECGYWTSRKAHTRCVSCGTASCNCSEPDMMMVCPDCY